MGDDFLNDGLRPDGPAGTSLGQRHDADESRATLVDEGRLPTKQEVLCLVDGDGQPAGVEDDDGTRVLDIPIGVLRATGLQCCRDVAGLLHPGHDAAVDGLLGFRLAEARGRGGMIQRQVHFLATDRTGTHELTEGERGLVQGVVPRPLGALLDAPDLAGHRGLDVGAHPLVVDARTSGALDQCELRGRGRLAQPREERLGQFGQFDVIRRQALGPPVWALRVRVDRSGEDHLAAVPPNVDAFRKGLDRVGDLEAGRPEVEVPLPAAGDGGDRLRQVEGGAGAPVRGIVVEHDDTRDSAGADPQVVALLDPGLGLGTG